MSLEAVIFTALEEAKELAMRTSGPSSSRQGQILVCVCVGAGLVLPLGGDPAGEAGSPPGGQ